MSVPHRIRIMDTASAPGSWQARCSCGWTADPTPDEASAYADAERHQAACEKPGQPVGTGYLDAYGNVWVYNTGHTVIDGVTVRGQQGRRMLLPGEVYYSTRGERKVVGCQA